MDVTKLTEEEEENVNEEDVYEVEDVGDEAGSGVNEEALKKGEAREEAMENIECWNESEAEIENTTHPTL